MSNFIPQPSYGRVTDFAPSFKGGKFHPFNIAYGMFHPTVTLGFGKTDAFLPALNKNEYFQVQDKRPWKIGEPSTPMNFLVYADAYSAAQNRGEQGSQAEIVIKSPAPPREIIALDGEGNKVVVQIVQDFISVQISSRLVFSKPYAD